MKDSLAWDDLRVFLEVARRGSLSGAARELGLTQPTVGRRLKAMQGRQGVRLLERTPSGFVLTDAGEGVVALAEQMESAAFEAQRRVAGQDLRLSGVVRVTTIEIFAQGFMMRVAQELADQHPDIALELIPETRSLSLSKREADIAVRPTPFAGQELVVRKLGALHFGAYALRGIALEDAPLLTVLEDQRHLEEMRWFHKLYAEHEIRMSCNDRLVLQRACEAGLGIACLPSPTADRARLAQLSEGPPRYIWCGVHADLRRTPRIRVVLDAIYAQAELEFVKA